MFYVELEMSMPNGSVVHIGTSAVDELDRAVSQLSAYRDVAEMLVCSEIVKSYQLKLGTIPNALI